MAQNVRDLKLANVDSVDNISDDWIDLWEQIEIPNALIQEAKENRDFLKALKVAAVNNRKYELAAALRDLEVQQYPEAKTTSPEYEEAKIFKTALNFVEIGVQEIETAYVILAMAKVFVEKGAAGSLDDASKIMARAKEIFG